MELSQGVVTVPTPDESEPELEIHVAPDTASVQAAHGEGSSRETSSEQVSTPPDSPIAQPVEQPEPQSSTEASAGTSTDSSTSQPSGATPVVKTYPKRNRKAPNWYRSGW